MTDIDEQEEFRIFLVKLFFEWGPEAEETAVEFELEVEGDIEDRAVFIRNLIDAYEGNAEVIEEGLIINLKNYTYATIEELIDTPRETTGMMIH